jgi:hypothetical protein
MSTAPENCAADANDRSCWWIVALSIVVTGCTVAGLIVLRGCR